MATIRRIKRFRKLLIYTAITLVLLLAAMVVVVDRIVEPVLRKRIHTLIVQGSDSLYTYELGGLNASFFGGNVEVENLHITVDSNRYHELRRRNALPSLTMKVDLEKGSIRGINLIALLFNKRIRIEEILSRDADIRLSRHIRPRTVQPPQREPLWKSIQPDIEGIQVDRIHLDGVKFLYRNADTSESVKLQFDRFDGLFEDIRIDSTSFSDTTRVGFTKDLFLRFHDLKFRTMDSSYKMKAEWITYSSKDRTFEVDSFKIQPTLEEKEDFYGKLNRQRSMYVILFVKMRLHQFRLDRFIHSDIIDADSLVFETPEISIYNDRTAMPDFTSKMGRYPHQQLLKAGPMINIRHVGFRNGRFKYTEKAEKTGQEGTISLSDLRLSASNITNDPIRIRHHPLMLASFEGALLGTTPVSVDFKFFLDSTNGRYEATGHIGKLTAEQLNPIALPLANVQISSFNIHNLDFFVKGEDIQAQSQVRMRYNNLALVLQKTDEETGITETKKFLTRIINKFVLWPDNPGPDGVERVSSGQRVGRLTTQSFMGLFWKAIFAGMQDVMVRSGRYE